MGSPDALTRTVDVAALFSRDADGAYRLEAGLGFPKASIGIEVPQGIGLTGRAIVEHSLAAKPSGGAKK